MKNLHIAGACIMLIIIIVALSGSPIGKEIITHPVKSISKEKMIQVTASNGPGIPIYKITITNNHIPRQYDLPKATACLYNTKTGAGRNAGVEWDITRKRSEFREDGNTIELYKDSKTVNLEVLPYTGRVKPIIPEEINKPEIENYNQLLLWLSNDQHEYSDCFNLNKEKLQEAIKITIV